MVRLLLPVQALLQWQLLLIVQKHPRALMLSQITLIVRL